MPGPRRLGWLVWATQCLRFGRLGVLLRCPGRGDLGGCCGRLSVYGLGDLGCSFDAPVAATWVVGVGDSVSMVWATWGAPSMPRSRRLRWLVWETQCLRFGRLGVLLRCPGRGDLGGWCGQLSVYGLGDMGCSFDATVAATWVVGVGDSVSTVWATWLVLRCPGRGDLGGGCGRLSVYGLGDLVCSSMPRSRRLGWWVWETQCLRFGRLGVLLRCPGRGDLGGWCGRLSVYGLGDMGCSFDSPVAATWV